MSTRAFTRSGLVWLLLLCVLLANGLTAAPSVAHAAKHGSHESGTHSTGLCAWLCAAGHGVEASSLSFESTLQLVDRVHDVGAGRFSPPQTLTAYFRGPPPRS